MLETYGLHIGVGLIALLAVIVTVILVMKRRTRAPAHPPLPAGPPMVAPAITPPTAALEGKFCINCGSQIPQASAFCPRCGVKQH